MTALVPNALEGVVKLVLIANTGVGKTSLAMQCKHEGQYVVEKTKPSVGIEFVQKEGFALPGVHGQKVLQIWDCGRYDANKNDNNYYRGAAGAAIVYSAINQSSFDNVTHWIEEWNHYKKGNALTMLVCNKTDLAEDDALIEQGRQLVKKHDGLLFAATSATQDQYTGCQEALEGFVQHIFLNASQGATHCTSTTIRV